MIQDFIPPPAAAGPKGAALFLDRDGTIIHDRDYLWDPAGVELLPGVGAALAAARRLGYRLFILTNQSGIARGLYGMADVIRCNERMEELLGLPRPIFDSVCIAPEGPQDPVQYRKPSPRFITETIARYRLDPARCWMIGDRESDVKAGLAAGVRAAAVCTGKLDAAGWSRHAPADVTVYPGLAELAATLPPADGHA
ncbi:MAG: D-glycero-alpha-D-manno-heptose-1,7-bisphosphate 7-phosphatase [Opitutaceae bacterium]